MGGRFSCLISLRQSPLILLGRWHQCHHRMIFLCLEQYVEDIGKANLKHRYPPVTDEQTQLLYKWFSTRTPDIYVPKVPKILEEIEATYGKKKWAGLGVRLRIPVSCSFIHSFIYRDSLTSEAWLTSRTLAMLGRQARVPSQLHATSIQSSSSMSSWFDYYLRCSTDIYTYDGAC
jgi:hypothetical protein